MFWLYLQHSCWFYFILIYRFKWADIDKEKSFDSFFLNQRTCWHILLCKVGVLWLVWNQRGALKLHKTTNLFLKTTCFFCLSSRRCLSLNRALWEIRPPATWPLCRHSYRTHRTVWSTVPLTREGASGGQPGGPRTWTTGMSVSLSFKKKKKDQKNQSGLHIYQRKDCEADYFPLRPSLSRTGADAGLSGAPRATVGCEIHQLSFIQDTGRHWFQAADQYGPGTTPPWLCR